MKKFGFWAFVIAGVINGSWAQVGINTVDPHAQLDIVSSNPTSPTITDGILIPRVANFPVSQPTGNQNGMLIFLTEAKANFPIGFYYWSSATNTWNSLSNTAFSNFYKDGTTNPSDNIEDGIYRYGNIGIGVEDPTVQLSVLIDPSVPHSIRTALQVDNSSSTPQNVTYSILSDNWTSTSSKKYGIKNNVSSHGKGIHYGIYNEVYQSSVEEMYGIYNKVGRTYGAGKNHYGIYTHIGTPTGTGMAYGIYSTAEGENPERLYAGYFAGRVGIGRELSEEYIFPEARGKRGETLVLGEDGKMVWTGSENTSYTSTGSSGGAYSIPETTSTLQINNQVSSITIPPASQHKGRIIILLGWNGISTKPFNFSAGNDLWDITIAGTVSRIAGGQRLTIQSTGTRWVVINNQ